MSKPKLEELNKLLSTLNLPAHRKTVNDSGSNLPWLRKHVHKKNEVSPELQTLLDTPDHVLMAE